MKDYESPHEYTRRKARQQGYWDASKGLPSDPGRHDALEHSAWATWWLPEASRGARGMNKLLLAILLCLPLPSLASDPWSEGDIARQAAYTALHALDYRQTSRLADHGHGEANPLLGVYPSQGRIDRYFIGTLVLHYWIADKLPSKHRRTFQYITISVEAAAVGHNYSMGIRFNF